MMRKSPLLKLLKDGEGGSGDGKNWNLLSF